MAWRLTNEVIGGVLDNRVPGRVTGHLYFRGVSETVTVDLAGDFESGIAGGVIRIGPPALAADLPTYADHEAAKASMAGLRRAQVGKVDYIRITDFCLTASWFDADNGRVVIEPAAIRITREGPDGK